VSASAPGTAGRVRVRDDLAGMVPYGAPQLDVPVRLNTNETPYAVPADVLDALAEAVRGLELHRYPDREATELREALALHTGHGFEGTWAANGSNEVCAAAPGLVVVDEAYGEFGASHAAALLSRHPNLVVTRTFSKAFRMAGLRLGYLLADPAVVDGVRLVRLPYHLSTLTQVVGLRALQHKGALMSHVVATERERERVAAALDRLPGIRVLPSDANFLCFETPRDPRRLWRGLLDRGVLVRDVSRFPTLDRHLRVTIGTPAEDDAFLTALTEELSR
jgi:histidinol-phosphate/aromatic aminotransferase/cobyric acid decarboxylase-like protein